MEPAASIIEKLGGPSNVARTLGMHRVSVAKWKRSREDGGRGGVIPIEHIRPLMDMAEAMGVALSADDFIPKKMGAA